MDKLIYSSLGETLYTFTHSSGLPVILIQKKGFTRKFGVIGVDFGSVNTCFQVAGEPITTVPQGIAHFLEHKLFEQEDGNVLEKYTRMGASPNAATGFSNTYYYFNCTDRFEDCLRLLLHFVFHPHLTPENVEKEKGIIEQEIRMYEDDPYYQSMLGVIRLLYQKNPVRNDIAGSVEDIRGLNRDLLMKCYNTFYRPDNMCLTIVADEDPVAVQALVESVEVPGNVLPGVRRISEPEPAALYGKMDRKYMDVSLPLFHFAFKDWHEAYRGAARVRRDLAGTIAKEMLFGRHTDFYEQLYAEGLINQEFGASYEIEREFALAMISGETERPEEVENRVRGHLAQIAKVGLDLEDFRMVRASIAGKMLKKLNSPESLGTMVCVSSLQGVQAFDYFTACGTITFDEVDRVFREVFLGDMAVSLVENERSRSL